MHVMQFCVVGETVITDISDQLHIGTAFIKKKKSFLHAPQLYLWNNSKYVHLYQ